MKKKILICTIILIILVCSILGILILLQNQPAKTQSKENIKNETVLTKTQLVNGIEFTNIECTYDGYAYLIEYTMTNTTTERIQLTEYELIIKDKEENILANISPAVEISLAPNESYDTGNSINIDLSTAYSIEIQTN